MRRALIIPLYICYAIIAVFGLAAMGIERMLARRRPSIGETPVDKRPKPRAIDRAAQAFSEQELRKSGILS